MKWFSAIFIASIFAALFIGSSSAEISGDPVTCAGYPEKRLYLENQSWWEPQSQDPAYPTHPGTGKQGHIHVGTCFPMWQKINSDTLRLDLDLKLHNMTGNALHLFVNAYGDYHYEVPRTVWTDDGSKWHCSTSDCEKRVSVDFPMTQLKYKGVHEWNVQLIVWKSDSSVKQYTITRWYAEVDRNLPSAPSGSDVWYFSKNESLGVGGDSWYSIAAPNDKYARVAMLKRNVPWNQTTGQLIPVPDSWSFTIQFEKKKNFVYINPTLHTNPPSKGIVVWEGTTNQKNWAFAKKTFTVNTANLSPGIHRLVFGSGNVVPEGTNTGVGVIQFLVT